MSDENPAMQWAREQLAAADTQRALAYPLYVSHDMPPHVALKNVRDFASRLVGPDDKYAALVVVALDRILDTLASYRARVVYDAVMK